MKTLERYVFKSFLSSFVLAFLVLSFVLTIGLLVQIVGFVMDGVPIRLVGEFCLVSLPETLQWSVPLALLVSSVLVFSRLSADSEIAAMRSCGVHLLSVMKWPLVFALCCTLAGFYVNNEVVPRGHQVRRTLKKRVSVGAGLSVLEPGRVITDFPKVKLYFERKEGSWLYDLMVSDYSDTKVNRMITAEKALVTQVGKDIRLDLYGMTVDPLDAQHPTMARFNRFTYTVKDCLADSRYVPRLKDMRFGQIFEALDKLHERLKTAKGDPHKRGSESNLVCRELCETQVELNKRMVFAMASLCFVLVGIPLGIRSQRKESSIGMAISIGVSLGYYVIVILMLSLENAFAVYPQCLIWLPVAVCLAISAFFVRKHL